MSATVSVELPLDVYNDLQALAQAHHTDPVIMLTQMIKDQRQIIHPHAKDLVALEEDPIFAIIGAFASPQPLIDGIPVSEDPDLYSIAESLANSGRNLHAWEIAPHRYLRSEDGKAIRRK